MEHHPVVLAQAALPLPLGDVLALGEQLARQLAPLHARGLLHGAVRPEAVVWSAGDRRATLLETGGAVAAPARGALARAGALPRLIYAAPEQSGRLEVLADARSDLYSLGVVLYQMLTGAPPFVGRDALEQVHWHIAGPVPPPRRRDLDLPRTLADLVLRLLAKSPDDRYQSALGLAEDLARCAAAWLRRGRIEPFALAEHERGVGLRFATALVGREREVAALRSAFEACAAGGRALVLVQGYAGIGKTALIQQLVRPIALRQGHFIGGKFDQVVRGVPFGALIQAFQALVRQLLGESEERLALWRAKLIAALGANAGVLIEVIPEIQLVIGAQPAPVPLGGAEARNRFQRVVQRFVAALATREHPLVLFLDDLQWADAATLSLLEPLITDPEIESLMLLGAFRDAELEGTPLLVRTLAALSAVDPRQAHHVRLTLEPLTAGDLRLIVAEALHAGADEAAPLAALVHAKTGGNPFFAMQFLRGLEREGQLHFDAAAGRWRWQMAEIEAAPLADNVVDLMTRSIRRLQPATQYLLTLAACIGNRFELDTLAIVSEQQPAAVARDLARALAEGLLLPTQGGEFSFLHDRVQQAAYALIPAERRHMVHLTVGRLMRARTSAQAPESQLFDLVHHLNLGRRFMAEPAERREVAALNLAAGRRAKSATAHQSALALFEAGLELLGADTAAEPAHGAIVPDRHMAFELALEAAECRYLGGDFEAALAAYGRLVAQAPGPIERARVLLLRCVQYENMARYAEALGSGREALAPFGVHLPDDDEGKRVALERELGAIDSLRAGRPIAALAELPAMTDAPTRMVMSVLVGIWSSSYIIGDPTLSRLISATLVRLSLEHGNVEESAYGYVTHAITVGALRADYRAADDYGHLALAVNRRFDDRRLRAKVLQQFHAHVNFWCQPVRTCMAYAKEACTAGLDGGDFLYAAYAAGTELWSAIAAVQDLAAFEREYGPSVAFIERLKKPGFADMVRLILAWARALQGRTAAPLSLQDAAFDEAAWCERYAEVRFFGCIHAVAHLQLAALLGTAQEALAAARRASALVDAVPGTIWPVLHEFWHAYALARAAALLPADGAAAGERAAMQEEIRAAVSAFAARVQHNAENHRPQALLLGAELARLEGRESEALALGVSAVEFTAGAPLCLWQALAHERLAHTQAQLAQPASAALHMARARELYRQWGAEAKVRALEAERPVAGVPPEAANASLAVPRTRRATDVVDSADRTHRAGPTARPFEGGRDDEPLLGLDMDSVLKAAQAIGAEVELDPLLARLLHIAIENAGAERGALVLEGAQGAPGGQGAVVHSYAPDGAAPLAEALEASTRVPLSVIHFVRRTGETVVLGGEPRHQGLLATDDYVRRYAPRSLACTPLHRLARVAGVLVVEHRHAAGVFTPARLAVLRALATQAAIALENAFLVAGLKSEVAERRAAQEWLAGALAEVERLKDDLEAENSYLRRDLIANVSHDLRTPLVSLRGYLEVVLAKGEGLGAAMRGEYLGIALRQSERLTSLVDELFELARLDFKGLTLVRERFACGELIADVVQKFQLLAEGRGVALTAHAAAGLPFVEGDLGLVERVLENLIGNALKHTPAGGRVQVRAGLCEDTGEGTAKGKGGGEAVAGAPAARCVLAEVLDSGLGISPEDVPHVFDRFYRGGQAGGSAAEQKGAGLGLAIARRIVELHGGQIGADSAPGQGARLWFTLPLAEGA